jgi:hypothetical protein
MKAALSFLAGAVLAAVPWAFAQSPSQIVVAVNLQRSPGATAILPVARFTGTQWVQTWPGPVDGRTPAPALADIPESWLGGPVPMHWTFLSPSGAATAVTVTGTERGRDGCETSVMLVVAGAPPAPRDPWAAGATRLAVAGDLRPEWIRAVPAGDPAMPALARLVHEAHRDNDRFVGGAGISEWTAGLAALDRAGATLQVETLVQSAPGPGPVLYYFDASRGTPRGARPAFMTYVSGWIARNADGTFAARGVSRGAFIGEWRLRLQPIAAFRTGSRVVWLSRQLGYESLTFVLDDVSDAAVPRLITALSDGC